MKRSPIFFALACLSVGILSQGLMGCGHQTAEVTPAEATNFKGGPMPASAAKIVAEKMRQANAPATSPAKP